MHVFVTSIPTRLHRENKMAFSDRGRPEVYIMALNKINDFHVIIPPTLITDGGYWGVDARSHCRR